jgi:N utilization substance protein A
VKRFLEVKLIDLGRRAILALRQNLISKYTNDNTNLYKQFKDLIGNTEVHHVRPRVVILVDDEGNEIVLLKKNKFLLTFRKGDNVRGIEIELKGNKPQIIMSRTSEVLEKLFEQEIPRNSMV